MKNHFNMPFNSARAMGSKFLPASVYKFRMGLLPGFRLNTSNPPETVPVIGYQLRAN